MEPAFDGPRADNLGVWLPAEETTGAVLLVPRGPLGTDMCLTTSLVVTECSGQRASSYLWMGIPDLRKQTEERSRLECSLPNLDLSIWSAFLI
ncbi:hypothetical protein U0070_012328 [Myodes glareolus]|uniref:Uncharacterized protein n=1 Tax=Myodes glareolus TaxID=447135 RepID=A0AAW0IZD5_MYOGA